MDLSPMQVMARENGNFVDNFGKMLIIVDQIY